ncbi:MAG: response regulator [Pseudanabaenaceae cyanobacterium]|jgi:chemotaxis family two-component system response regulator PixG
MDTDSLAVYSIVEQLRSYSQRQFSGCIEIQDQQEQHWYLHYHLGRIIWATGGHHSHRRWRRLMSQHKLHVDLSKISLRTPEEIAYWDYHVLVILLKRQSFTRDQISPVVEHSVHEVLFDILQQAAAQQITYYGEVHRTLSATITLLHGEQAVNQVYDEWLQWRKLGMTEFSPNLAPWIKRPEQLHTETSELTYKTLITILDGRRTLRELALWMRKDVMTLMQSLLSYYHRGLIGLNDVPDARLPNFAVVNEVRVLPESTPVPEVKLLRPLIACIDDSAQVCAMLESMAKQLGMGFLGLNDPIQGLSVLLKEKPDLVILDLTMPIVSGYELCAQLRRSPEFQSTPILILTSNDGLIDRVRAKMVGATSFLSKNSGLNKIAVEVQQFLAPEIVTSESSPAMSPAKSEESGILQGGTPPFKNSALQVS